MGTDFDLRAEQVREQVALYRPRPSAREERIRWNREIRFVASVALQIHQESEVFINVYLNGAAASVQAVPLRVGGTWCIARERVVRA